MTTIVVKKGTVLPVRATNDVYQTEETLIHAALQKYLRARMVFILDPGAGDGRWGRIAGEYIPDAWVTGVEIEDIQHPAGFSEWHRKQDFISWETETRYDFICGNPPYFLAEEFVRKSWELLKPGGRIIFLLRLAFMEGVGRYYGLWNEIWPYEVSVCSRRPSFYGGGTNGTAFAVFAWQKSILDGSPVGDPRSWRTSLLLYDRDKNHRGRTPSLQEVTNG